MTLRAVALAAVTFRLRAASSPGCGCPVSDCCGMLHSGELGQLFDSTDMTGRGYTVTTDGGWEGPFSPTCTFLNLIQGVDGAAGLCANASLDEGSPTVCDAIATSAPAESRLESGKSLVSLFLEKGTCAEVESDTCWESPEAYAAYTWLSLNPGETSCSGTLPHRMPALASSVGCSAEGGLKVKASWVDPDATDIFGRTFDSCSGNYFWSDPEGLEVNVGHLDWNDDSEGSPRWRCFDVPRGDMGTEDYRALVYSIGDLPCLAPASPLTNMERPDDWNPASIAGAAGVGLAAVPLAVAAAAHSLS